VDGGFTIEQYKAEVTLRLLYSFYCTKGGNAPFGVFAKGILFFLLPPNSQPIIDIELCLTWFDESLSRKANYLVLVDEIEKSLEHATNLCTYICKFMDRLGIRYDCFFTNLNSYVMGEASTTRSQRPVNWITLPPATFNSVREIFQKYDIPPLIVIEASAHWRSIILLLGILDNKENTNLRYDNLLDLLLSRLSPFVKSLSTPIIEACFSRRSYLPSDRIENIPASELISNGLFLNSIDDLNSPFYPEISLLLLKQYATLGSRDSHLKGLFSELFKLDSNTSWSFSSYESFHCHWLAIFHYCRYFETDRITTISKFYTSSREINGCQETEVKFERVMHVESVTLADIKEIKFNIIYLLGEANPGFDSIIFYQSVNNRTIAVASENKFSKPTSTTMFSSTEMVDKRNLAIKTITTNFGIAEADIYIVFVIWRDAPDYMNALDGEAIEWSLNTKSDVGTLHNVIVLRREDLKFLYGPLHRRMYFQSDVNSTVSTTPTKANISLKKKGETLESDESKKAKVEKKAVKIAAETTEEIVVEVTEVITDET